MPADAAADAVALVASRVRDIPGFPSEGVVFKDITPVLGDPAAFAAAVDWLARAFPGPVDQVAAIEARGFILGAPVAHVLRAGLVPVRKVGKLPSRTVTAAYTLEYGEATLEMHVDALRAGDRVLVVDDVIATGGTAAAVADLIEQLGGTVVGVQFLIELADLNGRAQLAGREVRSVITYG